MAGAEYGVLVQLQESITTTWPSLVPAGDLSGKPAIPLGLAVILIGSRQSANIRINSTRVSRAHALVVSSDGRVLIRDLASRTGTTVNDQRIREAKLAAGDQVGIGPFLFEFAQGLAMPPLAERRPLQPAKLEVLGGEVLHTDQRITLIGQRSDCDVVIDDENVSMAHAALFDMDGRRYVRDLGSRLGTYVNGKLVGGIEIRLGDEIRIGKAVLRYLALPPAPAGTTGGGPRTGELTGRINGAPRATHDQGADERALVQPAIVNADREGNGQQEHADNGHADNGHGSNGQAIGDALEDSAEHEMDEEDAPRQESAQLMLAEVSPAGHEATVPPVIAEVTPEPAPTECSAPVVEREFQSPEDWVATGTMLQANLLVLPVRVTQGATLMQMPEPVVQWPAIVMGRMMSPVMGAWAGASEEHGNEQTTREARAAEEKAAAVEAAAASCEEPEIGEIEVIWTPAESMSASMTVDLVWDEPQTAPAHGAPHGAPYPGPRFSYAPTPMATPHPAAHAAPAETVLEAPVHSVVATEVTAVAEKPAAPEPQTVGWTNQGNPEGWGPLAAAVTVAPIIGTAPPASTPAGAQSIPRGPLLPQGDGGARPAPRSASPQYSFDAPLDLTPLWYLLGFLGVAGFAALMWFVVVPMLLPGGTPTPGGNDVTLPGQTANDALSKRVQSGRTPESKGPASQKSGPTTQRQARPASRPVGWLE